MRRRGLVLLGLAVTGVVLLIFDTVAGTAACGFVLFTTLWGVLPPVLRRSGAPAAADEQ